MTALARSYTFLRAPLGAVPRALLVLAGALVITGYLLPLWNLTMFAPQYPEGLRLDIYAHALDGGNHGQDIKEINVLNHYIGMRNLAAEDFTEFRWMPFVLGGLALIDLRAAVLGSVKELIDALVLFTYFGAFSLWSFGHRLYLYGHTLAPDAAVKVPPFMPPMFGRQQLANFEVYSYPQAGSYVLACAMAALVAAVVIAWRQRTRVVVAG
jgi:hypothetical protein